MDSIEYLKRQDAQAKAHEALCKRCGICCGALGNDPCSNLKKDSAGKYYCATYDRRYGLHLTVGGRSFMCVSIRDVLKYSPLSLDCGYAK